ncbi:MAG TPA: GTP cyclohydrolase I, partial [Anaerolineales bacterium]|nr:GTP cyclohydrolase I [Anaerolineales bacterium]
MTLLEYPLLLMEDEAQKTQLNLPPTPERRAQINNEVSVYNILENIGEEPQREGLMKTPQRVARMFDEL